MSGAAHDGFKSEFSEPRFRESSPLAGFGTSHKRTASGNPRPASRTTAVDERRTEKVQVTTRETLVSRTKSPERRGVPSAAKEKAKAAEAAKVRPPDARPKDPRVSPLPQGKEATPSCCSQP